MTGNQIAGQNDRHALNALDNLVCVLTVFRGTDR